MFDFSGMFAALIVFGVIVGVIGTFVVKWIIATFGWPVIGLVALGFVAGFVVSSAMGEL